MAEDYTYIVARIRAIEAAMPDRAWFQRLVRMSEDALLGALREYYEGFETVHSILEFEKGIEAEKAAVIDLVTGMIADPKTRVFLRAGYDFDNVLHSWKARRLGASSTLNPFGLVEPETVEKAIANGDGGAFPLYLRAFLEKLGTVGDSMELAQAEYIGEAAKWAFLLDRAPGKEPRAFVRARIDLINIKTFVRMKRTALRKETLGDVWIGGGEIEPARLAGFLKEPEEELYAFLERSSYRGLLRLGLNRDIPLWKIDPISRLQLLDIMGESRYSFFDISPVLYHLEIFERDVRLLRSIMVGRLNRMPEEIIMERVDALLPS
ncbi:MAG: V-type ATPase subunit [Candidatus Krumholzibacteria bacterium]|nr:V-type ATPase subunit [Candidatus Krumholzibacteria bacterium]